MAKDAVDAAVRELAATGRGGSAAAPPSVTEDVPLLGADGYQALWNTRALLAAESGLRRAGSSTCSTATGRCRRAARADRRAARARAAAGRRRSTWRSRRSTRRPTRAPCTWTTSWPAVPGSPSRPGTAGSAAAAEVAGPGRAGARLGRRPTSPARSSTTARVAAERESQHQPDDLSADAARLGAPDVRMGGRAERGLPPAPAPARPSPPQVPTPPSLLGHCGSCSICRSSSSPVAEQSMAEGGHPIA